MRAQTGLHNLVCRFVFLTMRQSTLSSRLLRLLIGTSAANGEMQVENTKKPTLAQSHAGQLQ